MNKFLEENDQKIVFNNNNGSYGYVLYNTLLTLNTSRDRINALLDQKSRGKLNTKVIHIDNYKWMELPKQKFSNYTGKNKIWRKVIGKLYR